MRNLNIAMNMHFAKIKLQMLLDKYIYAFTEIFPNYFFNRSIQKLRLNLYLIFKWQLFNR